MLKEITLTNYKTYINETKISLAATNSKILEEENVGKNRILKGALFVGENASGKTQILNAIALLLDLLFSNNELNLELNKSFYNTNPEYKLKYSFIIDDTDIMYELTFKLDKIVGEKLTCGKNAIIERTNNKGTYSYNDKKTFEDLSDNLLFLRRIYFDTHFYDDKILNKWFNFLKNSVAINCDTKTVFAGNNQSLIVHNYLDSNGVDEINKFFKKINYKQSIIYDTKTPTKNGTLNVSSNENKKFISFTKDGTNIYIPEMLESTGNITFANILPSFFHAIKNDCMVILDEFSSGLHNELEECLIKYFNHYAKNSQLIFTSHSTNLLNNTILRPDQIYSVRFDGKKGSVVKRFSDESPREAQNTEKMYLNGVFDDIPRYSKEFED